MDGFNKGFTSSASIKPPSVTNSSIHGNDENELSQEMASKLKIDNKKRLPTKHFMSTTISAASKAAVPRKKILSDRNETLDVEEQPRLSRSLSFDSKASRFPVLEADDDVVDSSLKPYDPIKNYLSPRPRFLRYNPDRLRKISVRQESLARVRRSASFDAEMPSSEELESNADCSSGDCSPEKAVEKIEQMIDKTADEIEHEDEHEDEHENEEEFDEHEEDGAWNSKMFLKYMFILIVLILTTLAISSKNSPTLYMDQYNKTCSVYRDLGLNSSEFGGQAFDSTVKTDLVVGNLNKREIDYGYEWDKMRMVETTDELVEMHHGKIEVEEEEEEEEEGEEGFDQFEELETVEENSESKEVEIGEAQNQEECYYELQEPVILVSEEIETHMIEPEKEIYDQNDVVEKLEISKMLIEENVVGEELRDSNGFDEIEDTETTKILIKLLTIFDPVFAAFTGVGILILVSLDFLYCSKTAKRKYIEPSVESMSAHEISTKTKNLEPVNHSSFLHKTHKERIVNPKSLMLNLTEKEVSKQASYDHAPTVELLSEFVIAGGEVTSFLRSCGMKDSNMLAEDEPSSFSRSHGNNNESLIQTNVVSYSREKSSYLELSTAVSPSNGSITTEKKIVKKQRTQKAEVMPSPVRRSSRIQSRSVMSP